MARFFVVTLLTVLAVHAVVAETSYDTVKMTDAEVATLTTKYTALAQRLHQRLMAMKARVEALEGAVKSRNAGAAAAMNPIPGGSLADSLGQNGGQQTTADIPPPPSNTEILVSSQQLCCAMTVHGKRLSSSKCDQYTPYLNAALKEGQITTKKRIAAFLAQIGHESASLKWWTELGGRSYFRKYDGRRDLGNTQPGDGYRFRGRGPIQLTGRNNYQKAGQALGVDLTRNPDVVSTPTMGFRTTVWYWTTRKLNRYCDSGDFRTLTKRINGGYNGYADRVKYWNKAKQCLGGG
eukprot:TRINITY_DN10807_c0_g1_i2.p1 TRINITY_DN10807_c0_g1~~TRINITY_DN10807_c0_g1_i2.p1  ORF type:complete len:293 (+),score=75.69 TRINITY_DN10807_c0_g1_i2:319-1197(+)